MLTSMQAIAHGADSVQHFQWRRSRGAAEKFHGAVVDHYGKEDTRVFRKSHKQQKCFKSWMESWARR